MKLRAWGRNLTAGIKERESEGYDPQCAQLPTDVIAGKFRPREPARATDARVMLAK